jgi:large subunit ribosomal protein L32
MAVPKRRTSKRKKRARNTHKIAPAIVIQECPRCQSMKRPHHVCAECGYYDGEQRVAAKEA